jgi:DNA-binding SARP family transcriptional activator
MTVRIRLLGELDIRGAGGEPIAPIESARARSLLAYLLLHDTAPQSRQRLAFLLWPDSAEGQARTNLRHVLHTLRTTGPELVPFLDVTPHTVRWDATPGCWTDVGAFAAALARAAGAEPAGDVELAALGDAVDLYGGDLLDGCYDDWLLEERGRFRDRYLWALRRLAGLLATRGDHGEAIRLGRELLRLDPLREDTYRVLMRIHDAEGDRASAVRTYHECVSTLRRELAVEPSRETTQAYIALMRPPAPSSPAGPEPDTAPVDHAATVGREDEWRGLTESWRAAVRGQTQLVLLTGEPGIGKTRLAEDLAAHCAHQGAIVAQGRSYPSEGALAFGVVLSWLRTPEVAAHRPRMSAPHRAALARLLPELGADEPEAGDPSDERRRLFEAVAAALVGSGRPALLVADDAQWCDEQSLQVIHYLVRSDPPPPLLVVATVRRDDLDDAHALGDLVTGLQAVGRVSEIALGRLAPADTGALAAQLVGHALDPSLAAGLHAETEGNPLFIVETLRAGWQGPAPGLSPRLQAVITARLRQVSDPSRELLGLAATVGRQFTAAVLAAASSVDDVGLVRSLDELWRRGLIREQGSDAYDFAHGRIRDVAYDALNPAERRRNHRLIADALVRVHGRAVDAVSGEVALHHDRGGRVEQAVIWYRRAAAQSQRLHADVEAIRLLDRAGDLVATLPDSAGRHEAEMAVLTALPTPLAGAEGFASPRLAAIQDRVFHLASEAGINPAPELLRSLVMSSLCRHDFDGARALAATLGDSARDAGDDLLAAETEYLLGICAFWAGIFETAQQHFEAVGARFDPARRTEHALRFGHDPGVVSLSRLANTLWFLGRSDDARRVRDDAVAMAEQRAHPFSRSTAYVFAALLAVDLGEPAIYLRYADLLAGDRSHEALRAAADAFAGYAEVLDGRSPAGIARIRGVIDARRVDRAPGQGATHYRLLVAAHDAVGDAEGVLIAVNEALAAPGSRIWDPEHQRLRARYLATER